MGIIVEYQYFPPSILFKNLCTKTHVVFEQYENFQKMSFRNRVMVAGANGSIVLSIPLQNGRNQNRMTRDVLIDNRTSWQAAHWKTIVSCYNKSPWFEFYREELHGLYNTRFLFLIDWNLACFNWIIQKMDFDVSVSLTEKWNSSYPLEKWQDWRNLLFPNSIHSKFPEAPKYRQVFDARTGFIPHLSILDLLFCEGKNARLILDH